MGPKLFSIVSFLAISSAYCEDQIREEANRDARFSIFQIIKFANEPCTGNTRNGTCFTKQECEDQGGTESGSCADGFGTCCSVVLEEGGSSSLNQSYMVQASTTSLATGPMTYTICPCSSDVCRIRFDFTQFMLTAPYAPATGAGTGVDGAEAFATGDCLIDTFKITGPQGGTPAICGTNEGQHMIVDTDGSSCVTVDFGIGGGTATRQWDIMTTQYRCGEEAGGPQGCLQWHMAAAGSFRSFNFPLQARGAAVSDDVVHLSSQRYSICIRKPAGTDRICYIPCTVPAAAAADDQQAFGLSIARDNANAQSAVGVTECSTDYIEILGGTSAANVMMTPPVAGDNSQWCGRSFNWENGQAAIIADVESVCTRSVPFKVRVNFDENEKAADPTNAGTADTNATDGEFATRPGGIIGFSLCYATA